MTKKIKKNACKRCSKCCLYFAIPMDPPEGEDDFDDLAWMLVHEGVSIHVGEDQWEIVVKNKCKYIDPKKGCKIYDRRPNICRDHKPGECDANATNEGDFDGVHQIITTLWELDEYKIKKAS